MKNYFNHNVLIVNNKQYIQGEECGFIGHIGSQCEVIKFLRQAHEQHNLYYENLGFGMSYSQAHMPSYRFYSYFTPKDN